MRITRIAATDFMGYEELDLDLADVGQVAITGLNNHGKSAILDALLWTLYGRVGREVDQRSADRLIRRGCQTMTGVVSFTTPLGHEVTVTREKPQGRTGTLDLIVDGAPAKQHTLSETQVRIERLIGLDFDALLAGPFMVQEQSSIFMKAQPRDRKDLLIRLLGLDQYEPLHTQAKGRRIEARARQEKAEEEVERLGLVVENAHEFRLLAGAVAVKMAALQEAQALASDRMATAKAQLESAFSMSEARRTVEQQVEHLERSNREAAEDLARMRAQMAQIDAVLAEAEPVWKWPERLSRSVVDEADAASSDMQMAISEAMRARAVAKMAEERYAAEKEREQRRKEVPCRGEGIYAACPLLVTSDLPAAWAAMQEAQTLAASWMAKCDRAEEVITRAKMVADEYGKGESAYMEVEMARRSWLGQRAHDEQTLAGFREHHARTADWLARDLGQLDQAKEHLAVMAPAQDTTALQETRDEAAAAYTAAHAGLREAEQEQITVQRRLGMIELAEKGIEEGRRTIEGSSREADLWAVLEAAWHRDGVPTSVIERAIPLIEERANEVLARLPEDLRLALRTQRTTKTGMAETLDVVVSIDGWESDYALLSVGARFRVDLALRVALAEILTRRSGTAIQTLWMDEPLAALDAPGREAAVEALSALSADFGLIVVVSHHADFSDRLPARIGVTKEAGVSEARLMT